MTRQEAVKALKLLNKDALPVAEHMALDMAIAILPKVEKLEAELAAIKEKWIASEKWRKAYQEAKHKLFEMGGGFAEAAMDVMPCNESTLDQWFRAEYVHRDALDNANAELAAAKRDAARLDLLLKTEWVVVKTVPRGLFIVRNKNMQHMSPPCDTPRAAIDAAMGAADATT